MTCPTPRDVARARAEALIREAVDSVFRERRVAEWNEQHDRMVTDILKSADRLNQGVVIEVSIDANTIDAYPAVAVRPGWAAVYYLDGAGSGPHIRRINLDQLREHS